jgi:hypothetical protein
VGSAHVATGSGVTPNHVSSVIQIPSSYLEKMLYRWCQYLKIVSVAGNEFEPEYTFEYPRAGRHSRRNAVHWVAGCLVRPVLASSSPCWPPLRHRAGANGNEVLPAPTRFLRSSKFFNPQPCRRSKA